MDSILHRLTFSRFCFFYRAVQPEPGYWSMHLTESTISRSSVDKLYAMMDAASAENHKPITFQGTKPGAEWPLTGFYATILPHIMLRAQIDDYNVTFYPTYTRVLYETTKTKKCDVGYAPFTYTPERTWCNATEPASSIRGCENPAEGEEIAAKHACCARFGVAIQPMTVGLLVTGKRPVPNVYLAILNYSVLNIVSMMMLAVLVAAHLGKYFIIFYALHDIMLSIDIQ